MPRNTKQTNRAVARSLERAAYWRFHASRTTSPALRAMWADNARAILRSLRA